MTVFARIRLDAGWANGPNLLPSELATLDTNTTAALNGDGGGIWAPSVSIPIGGAGMWLASALWQMQSTGLIQTIAASGKKITLGDNDYPVLYGGHTGTARTIRSDCTRVFSASPALWDHDVGQLAPRSLVLGADGIFPLNVHHGATFVSVTVTFLVSVAHNGVGTPPAILPKFRVYSVDANGTMTQLASASASGYVPFTPTPASGTVWYNAGSFRTFVVSLFSSPPVVVDVSRYSYFLEVVDESGSNAFIGNIYLDALCTFSGIADAHPG